MLMDNYETFLRNVMQEGDIPEPTIVSDEIRIIKYEERIRNERLVKASCQGYEQEVLLWSDEKEREYASISCNCASFENHCVYALSRVDSLLNGLHHKEEPSLTNFTRMKNDGSSKLMGCCGHIYKLLQMIPKAPRVVIVDWDKLHKKVEPVRKETLKRYREWLKANEGAINPPSNPLVNFEDEHSRECWIRHFSDDTDNIGNAETDFPAVYLGKENYSSHCYLYPRYICGVPTFCILDEIYRWNGVLRVGLDKEGVHSFNILDSFMNAPCGRRLPAEEVRIVFRDLYLDKNSVSGVKRNIMKVLNSPSNLKHLGIDPNAELDEIVNSVYVLSTNVH